MGMVVAKLVEFFATLVASEQLFARVYAHMYLQMTFCDELFMTVITLVGLLIRVGLHVISKVTIAEKSSLAQHTLQ